MRKTLIREMDGTVPERAVGESWLDLEQLAHVEITSEDELFPIDHALGFAATTGWRAGSRGPQTIRLRFEEPQTIRRMEVHIVARAAERMQEFALFADGNGGPLREIVRQQFTFAPGGSTEELERYTVALDGVTTVELRIDPDRSHDPRASQHYATLAALRLG